MTWGRYPNPRALLLVLILIQGSVGFSIVDRIEPKSVVEGGSVIFHCTFSETPHYLFWNYRPASSKELGVLRIATCPNAKDCSLTKNFANYTELLPAKNGSLVINGAKRRNDGIYFCEGLRDASSDSANARLTVLVPPGSPLLASNNSSPLAGEAIALSCSSEGGNPVPSLKWRWLRADGTKRPDVVPKSFPPSKVFGTISSKVTTTMSVADHQSTVQCDALNAAGNVTSSVLKLEVFKLPGRAEIDIKAVMPREGDTVELTCASEGGNPKPTVTWSWIRENGEMRDLPPTSIQVTEPDRPFGRTISTLQIRVDHNDNRASVRCSAENRVGSSGVASKPVQVLYKPRVESFRHSPLYVLEFQRLDVDCRATGNPTPRVVWRKSGIEVVDVSGSSLRFSRLVPSNSGLYICTATNAAGSTQEELELRVVFPPSIINMPSKVLVPEGRKLYLKCIVNAYPDATVHWLGPDNQMVGMAGDDLLINSISRKQAGRYTCVARNQLTPTEGETTSHTARNSTDVVVKYLPSAPSIIISPQSSVLLNSDIWLQCNANSEDPGYPLPRLEWRRLGDNKILSTNGSYRIFKAQLADSGRYRCTPINDVGTGIVSETEIEVEEMPHFSKSLVPELIADLTNQDRDLSVYCVVVGKPLPKVTWSKDSVPITGTGDSAILYQVVGELIEGDPKMGYRVKSVLLWSGERRDGVRRTALRPDDNGNYSCEASNSRGRARSQMRLVVQYAPQFVDPQRKVAADLKRGRVSLRCPVSAQPQPIVTDWFLSDGRMVTHKSVDARFSVRNEPPQPTHRLYTSVLTINRLTEADLTFYRCFSRNSQGNNTLKIELKNQSTPETPTHFRAQTSTWESIYLSWVPGFNGGFSQNFDISVEWHNGEERKRRIDRDLYNLTNLRPNTSYTLRVAASNALGTGPFSWPPLVFTTEALFIPRVEDVILDIAAKKLRFSAPPGYCVRVDVSQDRGRTWLPFRDCLSHGEGSEIVASTAEEYRAALCLPRRSDVCSEFKLAVVSEGTPEVPLIVILAVAVACAVLIVALFAILIFFCIRRRPGRKNFEENVAHRRPQAVTINPYAPTPPSTGPALHHSPPVKPFALVTPTSGAVHPPNTPAYENGAASFGHDDGDCGRSSRGRASPWDVDKRNKTSTFGDSASVLTPHSNSSQDPLHSPPPYMETDIGQPVVLQTFGKIASNADPPPYTDTIRRAPRQTGMEMQTIAIRDGTDGVYPTLDSTPPRSMTISRSALSSPIPSTALQLSSGTIPRQPKKVIYEVVV